MTIWADVTLLPLFHPPADASMPERERSIPMEPDTRNPSRLSIVQLMKLVVFCAVGFACVAPLWQLWRAGVVNGGRIEGLLFIAVFESVAVPLVWVGLSLILVRHGAFREMLIVGLLLTSVSVALVFACWSLFAYQIPAYRSPLSGAGLGPVVLHILVTVALTAAAMFLTRGLASRIARRRRTTVATPR